MSSRFKTTINIIALFVIIGFAVSVYLLCRFHDAKSAKQEEIIYLPKFAPEFLKDIAREEYILVEIEPNDPRISKEWIKEHINQPWDLLRTLTLWPNLLDLANKKCYYTSGWKKLLLSFTSFKFCFAEQQELFYKPLCLTKQLPLLKKNEKNLDKVRQN